MTGRANQLEMTESGNSQYIRLESPAWRTQEVQKAGQSNRIFLQLKHCSWFSTSAENFNQRNWLCFLWKQKACKGRGFVLMPSRCLCSPHHIKLKDKRYIKSVHASSVFSLCVMVSAAERESVLRPVFVLILFQQHQPASVLPIPLNPLRLSDSVEEARSHGYKQHCHISLPCRHLFLFSGFVASSL